MEDFRWAFYQQWWSVIDLYQKERCCLISFLTFLEILVQQVTMQALLCQESHQELADRTGKSVLELDAGLGRPRVVAYPAPEAALLGLGQPYDPMGVLKPHLRRHNQKTIQSVKERNPDLVKNTYENNTEWMKMLRHQWMHIFYLLYLLGNSISYRY